MPDYVTYVIGAIVLLIVAWLVWWKPRRKSWCVVFYMVGRLPRTLTLVNWPDPVTGVPAGTALDAKLDQVIGSITGLPCSSLIDCVKDWSWDDVHVVYRALWDDVTIKPAAAVVSWRPGAPKTDYFPNEVPNPFTIDLTDDLTRFFDWVYDNCPADHYAVYFWGHSIGPGGLFEVAEKPFVAPPAPASAGSSSTPGPAPPAAGSTTTVMIASRPPATPDVSFTSRDISQIADVLQFLTARRTLDDETPLPSKVEVVLFQDCWMSTLETAYELESSVRYVVASQSLMPVGYDSNGQPGAVWPYRELTDVLLKQQDFAIPLFGVMKAFYDGTNLPAGTDPGFNRFPNPTMPLALIDLGINEDDVSAALTPPWLQLVDALSVQALGRDMNGSVRRNALLAGTAAGRMVSFAGGALQAGDTALLDVSTLCVYLQNPPAWPPAIAAALTTVEKTAIASAASALLSALRSRPLIAGSFESPGTAGTSLGFTGISVMHKGGRSTSASDPYLIDYVTFNFYKSLKFAVATSSQQASWSNYAFES